MKLVLLPFLMLVVCYATGKLLLPTKPGETSLVGHFRVHIGYSYLLVAFYVAYVALKDMMAATCATLVGAGLIWLLRIFFTEKKNSLRAKTGIVLSSTSLRSIMLRLALVSSIFLLAAWPYLSWGWGNYWHSGNYDIEDGLNGRDAYLDHQIFDTKPFLLEKVTRDAAWKDFSHKSGTLSPREKQDSYYAWYAGDSFRLQYSNLAFWSYLFQERGGMDMAIIHAICNLLLMALGIYSLSQLFFHLSPGWSIIAAFSSVAASFYLGTFWAGHVGSLMYGALAPMLASFVLCSDNKSQWKDVSPWLGLGILALAFTYPQALALGMAYWTGYKIYSSNLATGAFSTIRLFLDKKPKKILSILIAVVVLTSLFYELWLVTDSYRVRQDGEYRAWGLVYDLGILPLFFGYVPNASSLGNHWLYTVLTTVGITSAIAMFLCVLFHEKYQVRFARYFLAVWSLGLLFFYFFIRDSYYVYKYLYTHHFVFIIMLCAFIATSARRLILLAGAFLLAANILSDVVAGKQIFLLPHNGRDKEYTRMANFDKNVLQTTFVDLTGGERTAVRQTLKKNNIAVENDPRFAKYFIVRKDTGGDITGNQLGEPVFSTESLVVRKSPAKNYLMVRTWFEPEIYPADSLLHSIPFRWTGQGKNDNVGIYIVRPDHASDEEFPFLRICGQKGPSATSPLTLTISNGGGEKLGELPLEGTNCTWLPAPLVKDTTQPLILRAGAKGKKLHPPEDRTLLYRIFSVAWVDKRYDKTSLALFNAQDDIVLKNNTLGAQLGNGWWTPETYNNEHFRWASDGAEIILPNSCSSGERTIYMDMEIGPSHGATPYDVAVLDSAGNSVQNMRFSSIRQKAEFPASSGGIYRILTNSEHKQLQEDFRVLDFRVFSIEAGACQTPD